MAYTGALPSATLPAILSRLDASHSISILYETCQIRRKRTIGNRLPRRSALRCRPSRGLDQPASRRAPVSVTRDPANRVRAARSPIVVRSPRDRLDHPCAIGWRLAEQLGVAPSETQEVPPSEASAEPIAPAEPAETTAWPSASSEPQDWLMREPLIDTFEGDATPEDRSATTGRRRLWRGAQSADERPPRRRRKRRRRGRESRTTDDRSDEAAEGGSGRRRAGRATERETARRGGRAGIWPRRVRSENVETKASRSWRPETVGDREAGVGRCAEDPAGRRPRRDSSHRGRRPRPGRGRIVDAGRKRTTTRRPRRRPGLPIGEFPVGRKRWESSSRPIWNLDRNVAPVILPRHLGAGVAEAVGIGVAVIAAARSVLGRIDSSDPRRSHSSQFLTQ